MGFEQPAFLLALPLAALARSWLVRLAVALLVLGAAGPQLPLGLERTAVLVDQSPSASPEASRQAAAFAGPNTQFFGFAERVQRLPRPQARRRDLGERTRPDAALRAADLAGADRAVLISDGLWLDEPAAPMPVYTLRVPARPHARIARLTAPVAPARGEVVEVRALLETTEPTTARVVFEREGERRVVETSLPQGQTSLPYRFTVEGATTVRVRLESPVGNDVQEVRIEPGGPGRALVIDDPATARYLRAAGWEVREGTPDDLAETPEVLVIGGPLEAWGLEARSRLERYLREGGSVLWTATPTGLFFGGWERSALAEKIPLEPKPQQGAALVLVLDVSGSMATGQPSKLDRAVEGALELVNAAGPEDVVGLITFSDRARWLLEPRPMTYRARREAETQLAALAAEGSTTLGPAYGAAADALEKVEAPTRWVLVLSDGRIGDDPQAVLARARTARDRGVRTLTLALGADADRAFLEQLAREGGGRYFDLADPAALPATLRLLGREAFQPPELEGRFPVRVEPHAVTQGVEALPPLEVRLPARARPWAEVVVRTLDGDPVLALGQIEAGRVAALATDLSRSWKHDPAAARLMAQLARWLSRTPARPGYDWARTPAGLELWVYGRFDPLPLAQWGGQIEPLEPVAPLTYRLRLPTDFAGHVRVTSGDRTVFTAATPPPNEWPLVAGDEKLAQLARESGGAVLQTPADLPPPARKPVPVAPWLWGAAFALFLLERWRERRVG
ncbi:vWA domain-containing protein [Oceanithermus sp.]|uniref:vWA domain-containing protein n=1 Tax=Oceanithermus sp. TaxID=2268145 RepID=UPI0025F1AC77|nr:vWA domain-containing protein [Oceanithermus sp.]